MNDVVAAMEPYLQQYGYWALFAAIMLEVFVPPLPGETMLMAAGALAGQGSMHIALVLAAAWAGAVAGDNIGFAIGRFGGRRLVMRHGPRVGITEERLARAERFFARYGGVAVAAARFMPVLRHVNGIVAGTVNMPWWRFAAYNAVGAALWVGFWGMLAYEVGKRAEGLAEAVEGNEVQLILGATVLLLVGGLAYMLIRRWRAG